MLSRSDRNSGKEDLYRVLGMTSVRQLQRAEVAIERETKDRGVRPTE